MNLERRSFVPAFDCSVILSGSLLPPWSLCIPIAHGQDPHATCHGLPARGPQLAVALKQKVLPPGSAASKLAAWKEPASSRTPKALGHYSQHRERSPSKPGFSMSCSQTRLPRSDTGQLKRCLLAARLLICSCGKTESRRVNDAKDENGIPLSATAGGNK